MVGILWLIGAIIWVIARNIPIGMMFLAIAMMFVGKEENLKLRRIGVILGIVTLLLTVFTGFAFITSR